MFSKLLFLGLCFQRLLGAHSQSWKMINIYRKTKTKLPAEKMRTTNPNKKRFPDWAPPKPQTHSRQSANLEKHPSMASKPVLSLGFIYTPSLYPYHLSTQKNAEPLMLKGPLRSQSTVSKDFNSSRASSNAASCASTQEVHFRYTEHAFGLVTSVSRARM